MAEAPPPLISATPEARAVRAGGAIGGVPELAKQKISEWFKTAKTEATEIIGLRRAEAEINGNKQADPKIGELGVKVIKGIGYLVEKRGNHLETSAHRRLARAQEHERILQALRERQIEAIRKAAEYHIANTTLQMLDLPDRVGPGALLSRTKQVRELVQRVIDTASERWHGFWAERYNRVAERDLDIAVKYGKAAEAIRDFANKLEGIISSKERLSELERLKKEIENKADQTTADKEKLANQFGEILTTGVDIGKDGAKRIKELGVTEIKKQEKILRRIQDAVTATGTK